MTAEDAGGILCRPMAPNEAERAATLVIRSFDGFVAHAYGPEGVAAFHRYASADALRSRLATGSLVLVALAGAEIVGVIEMRELSHIALLFVAPEHLRRGIARTLFQEALAVCRAGRPDLREVTVNSSPYAVPVYQRFGFRPAGSYQVRDGIGFVPMVLALPQDF